MRRHCILRCIAVQLLGIVWASILIYKDTMYHSKTPELFWSNTSVVILSFELVPSSVNTLLLTVQRPMHWGQPSVEVTADCLALGLPDI